MWNSWFDSTRRYDEIVFIDPAFGELRGDGDGRARRST
jgi:hypothetical protein